MRANYEYPIPRFPCIYESNRPPIQSLESADLSSPVKFLSSSSMLGLRMHDPTDLMHRNLEKKIKTKSQDMYYTFVSSSPVVPSEREAFNFDKRCRKGSSCSTEDVSQQSNSDSDDRPWHQQQLDYLLNIQHSLRMHQGLNYDQTDSLLPPSFPPNQLQLPCAKIEDTEFQSENEGIQANIKVKEVLMEIKTSPTVFDKKPKVIGKSKRPVKEKKEPEMADFTKMFPEWDLRSIFEFLRSGKTKEDFEVWRKNRLVVKSRAAKQRKQSKLTITGVVEKS